MSKKFSLIALAIIAVLGSLVAFAASNLFFTDVPYFGPHIMDTAIFASFTALLFGAYFVIAPMYIVRSYLKPNIRKRMSKTYLKTTMVLAGLGFVFAILAAVINYNGNFLASAPFPGFIILMMAMQVFLRVFPINRVEYGINAKNY